MNNIVPGVYLIFLNRVCIYIGQSNDVYRRYNEHLEDELSNPKLFRILNLNINNIEFQYYHRSKLADRLKLERELIDLYKPTHNRV